VSEGLYLHLVIKGQKEVKKMKKTFTFPEHIPFGLW